MIMLAPPEARVVRGSRDRSNDFLGQRPAEVGSLRPLRAGAGHNLAMATAVALPPRCRAVGRAPGHRYARVRHPPATPRARAT